MIEGTATFVTPGDSHGIDSGEAIRFAPGEYQQGRNEGEEELRILALGAPKNSTELRAPMPCPDCGESDALSVRVGETGMTLECPESGAEVDA